MSSVESCSSSRGPSMNWHRVWGSLVHYCGKQLLVQCWLKWHGIFDTANPAKILDPYFQPNENLMRNVCEEMRLEMEQKYGTSKDYIFPAQTHSRLVLQSTSHSLNSGSVSPLYLLIILIFYGTYYYQRWFYITRQLESGALTNKLWYLWAQEK